MKIYHFDKETGEYVGSDNADIDPLNPDNYLIPAGATTLKPPTKRQGKVNMFKDGRWSQINDKRGQQYFDNDGHEITITALGEERSLRKTKPLIIKQKTKQEIDSFMESVIRRYQPLYSADYYSAQESPQVKDYLDSVVAIRSQQNYLNGNYDNVAYPNKPNFI